MEQTQDSDQQLLVVDEYDNFSGEYVARGIAHAGQGRPHRAFVCLIVNGAGQTLLQRRKHWLWDDLWDYAAVSHVLHLASRDESYSEAAVRALEREVGIRGVEVRKLSGFSYFAEHPVGGECENEYCAILLGRCDDPVEANPECVYELRWASFEELEHELDVSPGSYTPWARLAVATLLADGLWPPTP